MIRRAKHRGQSRPRTGGKVTEGDVKAWRHLVKRARAIAANPLSDALGFVTAAEKAGGAVIPLGHRDVDGPFCQLVRLGKRFLTLSGVERQSAADDVASWSASIVEALDDMPLTNGVRTPYADGGR